jgi:hypothetical protein
MKKVDVNSLPQRELIKGHPRLISLIELALWTGKLKYCPQAYETEIDEETKEVRRDGYYAEDVTGFWMPRDFSTYIESNVTAFKEAREEFGFWAAFKFLTLSLPWSGWCFVVDAKKTLAYEIVDEYYADQVQKGHKRNYQDYDQKVNLVTPEQINEKLKQDYLQIHPAIWVSPQDPTCFIVDEQLIPFAKKDGWTTNQMGEILALWFEAMTGKKVSPQYVPGAPW